MIIGVDFDNTIVCYDGLFHKLAVAQGLVPSSVPPAKNAVRDYLRQTGAENRWTELQGYAYGPGMSQARLYPGVPEFFGRCRRQGVELFVISHRTRYPFLGEQYDLHQAARDFLTEHGFNDPARIGLPADHIWFYETKAEKVAKINATGCTHFIDDLPEILAAAELNEKIDRILFDPNGLHPDCGGLLRFQSWFALDEYLLGASARSTGFSRNVCEKPLKGGTTSACNEPQNSVVTTMLAAAGLPDEFNLTTLPGGGNNRVYRVNCAGRPLLLKAYFYHPDDSRDRLDAEFSFSRFAWDHGIRCIPQPLARDDENHLGLYEFIEGRAPAADEIDASEVEQAAAFFATLNRHKFDPAAAALALASEACFTLAEHLDCVESRVQRLVLLNETSQLEREAAAWVQARLAPTWEQVKKLAQQQAGACGFALDEPLGKNDRCLSPSDFGFHNAIRTADNRLRFIDFEYAGWDDPAKTVCDFLCQPKLPAPEEFAERFAEAVVAGCSDAAIHRRRIALLLPVYRLKWCCIMMNEFLPVGGRRRRFAYDAESLEQRKRMQLEKSDRALRCVGM